MAPVLPRPAQVPPGAARGIAVPPAAPAVVSRHRLVPLDVPARALVCGYLHDGGGALTGTRLITAELAAIPAQLANLAPTAPERLPCAMYLTAC